MSNTNGTDAAGDDSLLQQLGQRQRQRGDQEATATLEHWAATGMAEARAAARNQSQAARQDEADALFAPWDTAAREQLAAQLLDRVRPPARDVIPLHARRRPRMAVVTVGGLLAAAGVALLLTGRSPDGLPELPAYALLVQGGDEAVRSANAAEKSQGSVALQPDSLLEILIRPSEPVAQVTAVGFVRLPGTAPATPLGQAPEISPEGAVRWRGTARQLLQAPPGDVEILVVVGTGPLPDAGALLAQPPGRHGTWQSLLTRVRITGPGEK